MPKQHIPSKYWRKQNTGLKNKKMKSIPFIFLIMIIGGFASDEIRKNRSNKISKLVFRHYFEVLEEGEQNAEIFQDSLFVQLQKEIEIDSLSLEMLKQFSVTGMIKATPETEIHIELKQDTIWRYNTEYGKIISDFLRIDREKGILYYHAKFDKSKIFSQFNLFEVGGEYAIEEYPNDKKEVLGFNCYKVIIRKKEQIEDDFPMRIGDTIYEMYVTREIDLPVHALLNFTKSFPEFFPLEVRTWEENLPGNQEVYEIREIK
jgi:hypothetical protein